MRILYLDLDALNPNHLSCYGYHRNTSPTIDQVAREGLRCTNVYTPDAPCLPSRTAFYSGRFGIHTGVVGHGGTAAQPKVQGKDRGFRDHFDDHGFARQLQKAGYHTAMISPFGQRHAAWHFYAGFNEIHNTGQGGMESAEVVQPVIEKWFNDHASEDNWYMHINFWDIHTPYRAPLDYPNPFKNEPIADWLSEELLAKHMRKTGPHSCSDLGMYNDNNTKQWPRLPERITDMDTLKTWIDGYDIAIRYVDDKIKWMVEKLKADGVYEDTVIIISADHGENQGDLGIYGEHGTADQGTCHIPMIIKWPGGAQGKVDNGLHYNLDWAPTVMDMIGKDKPAIWDGVSYAATVKDGTDAGRDDLVVSQCCHVCQRSSRWDNWLYVRTYHDGFHLFDDEMLFDIANDPHELVNLAAEKPEICKEGAYRLMNWHDTQMFKMARQSNDSVDPMWTVIREGGPHHTHHNQGAKVLAQYIERLKKTGREDGAKALAEKYADHLATLGK
jgi:arylsulfatase A-like enzyme